MNNDNYYLIIGSTFLKEDFDYAEKKYYKKNVMISNAIFEHKLLKDLKESKVKSFLYPLPLLAVIRLLLNAFLLKDFIAMRLFKALIIVVYMDLLTILKEQLLFVDLKKYLKRYLKMHISISLLLKFINHI